MKPAPSIRRAKPLPCGCRPPYASTPPRRHCPESERLWAAFQALGDRATTRSPEWRAYASHFERRGKP